MAKEVIIQKMKDSGCRITKQRMILLDIILEEDCSCCKEIYFKASKKDSKIGVATVYRMINSLEEIGVISRKNMFKVMQLIDCFAKAFYIGDKNILCAFTFLFRMNSTKKAETYVDAFFCYFIGNCSLQ